MDRREELRARMQSESPEQHPITACCALSRITDCPTMSCRPPKRFCHAPCVNTTVRGAAACRRH